jgi:hypothetical protein
MGCTVGAGSHSDHVSVLMLWDELLTPWSLGSWLGLGRTRRPGWTLKFLCFPRTCVWCVAALAGEQRATS